MTTVGIATGAGRGMGLACARRITGMVDTLVLVDRDETTVAGVAEELRAAGSNADVEEAASHPAMEKLVRQTPLGRRVDPRRLPPSSPSCCRRRPAS
jgi:NADP-dependent 3-hydroxy acid dehydrogenase YdfG